MSSKPDAWNKPAEYTWWEFFNPPADLPHIGIVKLSRKLEELFGKEKGHEIIDKVRANMTEESIAQLIGDRQIESFKDALSVFSSILGRPEFQIAHESEVVEVTDSKRVSNVYRCIWADAFRGMDAGDLGFIWACKQDHVLASTISPNFKLNRTKTLMQGHDCCNFTWYWEED